MAVDLEAFITPVAHQNSRNETDAEQSDFMALRLDEQNGLGVALGFSNNQLSKADYLHIEENQFTVIELSDLRDQIQVCHNNIRQQEKDLFNKLQMENPDLKKLPVKAKKQIEKACYLPLKAEMMQKWCGSIAISERLCRENNMQFRPGYAYWIVCKNGTDVEALDRFRQKMSGCIHDIQIITTNMLHVRNERCFR